MQIWKVKKDGAVALIFDRRAKQVSLPALQRLGAPCYRHMLEIDRFYQTCIGGVPVNTETHLMRAYFDSLLRNNTFWERSTQSVYFGTVDKSIFKPFESSISVVAHAFAHATTSLGYRNQSGALNESWSDVVAIMVEHFVNNTTVSAHGDWRIGEEILVRASDEKEYGTALSYEQSRLGIYPSPSFWR